MNQKQNRFMQKQQELLASVGYQITEVEAEKRLSIMVDAYNMAMSSTIEGIQANWRNN